MGSYGRNYNLKQVFTELAFHPNFVLPRTPKTLAGVPAFVWESAARFISPPKFVGEDEVFTSTVLADAVRYGLGDALVQRLRMVNGGPAEARKILMRVWDIIYKHNARTDITCEDLAAIIRAASTKLASEVDDA